MFLPLWVCLLVNTSECVNILHFLSGSFLPSDVVSSHLPVTDIPNSFRTPVPRDSIVHWVFLCSVFSPAQGERKKKQVCKHGFSQPNKPPLCALLCHPEVRNECFLNCSSWRKSSLEGKRNVTTRSAFSEFMERLCFFLSRTVCLFCQGDSCDDP